MQHGKYLGEAFQGLEGKTGLLEGPEQGLVPLPQFQHLPDLKIPVGIFFPVQVPANPDHVLITYLIHPGEEDIIHGTVVPVKSLPGNVGPFGKLCHADIRIILFPDKLEEGVQEPCPCPF